ncbi:MULTISPECIES: hypothetical protein [Streptomyces]|uniref:hypothetical protein n=1 Tax=Streptomyces lycopersici TaxID=2974589 RepID=UPI0021D07609|nr:hypothetical protein [Streptomyces sp. NEAU-383]
MEDESCSGRRERAEAVADPAVMAADRELYALLQREKFEGWRTKRFREELWLYGWRSLRRWMQDGTIVQRCREKGIRFYYRFEETDQLRLMADARSGLAVESVAWAVEDFVGKTLPAGKWDPDKGATLRTFFIGCCLYAFRDAFKAWARRRRAHLEAVYRSILTYEWASPETAGEEVAAQRDTLRRILEHATDDARAICALMLTGVKHQKEIGDQLGMTSKMVEGQLRRLRKRALAMAARGEVDVHYGAAVRGPAGGGR